MVTGWTGWLGFGFPLFRALREQLGLELKADKANMKVYVVESAVENAGIEN